MSSIRELAERYWQGEVDNQTMHPLRVLCMDGEEIADGLLFYKGIASANTVDTGAGLAMLDTGAIRDAAPLHAAVRRWRPEAPLYSAVFSHHHVDHVFGVGPFEQEAAERRWPAPQVYAQALVRRNFDRYRQTLGWNTAINIRQFELPPARFQWPDTYRYPDVEYTDRITFKQGDLTFELHAARGETEDATWTWIPERKILAPGDLFIWATPNAGNPQKVQRYAGEWATALREMAALSPELLVPGHGLPIFGGDRVQEALLDTATLLESLESQTLALMNRGATLDRVIHAVTPPAGLLEKPFLRPVYDDPQFIVRNIWRLYGGWWDGEPDNLLPAPRLEQAREWVTLAGGLQPVLDRAAALLAEGNLRLACHVVEFAVIAEPVSSEAHDLRRQIYAARAQLQPSTMGRNILNHAALASEQRKRDLAGMSD
ncbi:MAG: alkyl sulfatase dimerization domain-containing protein [Dehalococcoidia bacterium]